MAELSTLARPYAKAAFEYAVDAKDLQGWSDSLKTVAAVCQNDKVVSMLNSPSITLVQQAKRTIEICGNEINLKTQGFISVLAENKRLKLLPQISKQFETLKANREKTIEVSVVSAVELNDKPILHTIRVLLLQAPSLLMTTFLLYRSILKHTQGLRVLQS